jgi:hypothetical protein
MRRSALFVCLFFALISGAARANCNPPPPGLSFEQWTSLCSREIQFAYSQWGNGSDFYNVFVPSLYQMYVQLSQGGGASMPLAGAACAPAGASVCNSSGWLLTCDGRVWITGMQRC